jgi:predicted MFS family arabinose efflux permease
VPRSPLADFKPEVRRVLPLLVGFRLVSNAAFRYTFTFLPAIARGTGFSVEELGRILSARDLTAVLAPWMGRLSDRHSTRRLMAVMSGLLVVGLVLASLGPLGLVIGFLVVGMAKLGYDVSMNAWVGESIAYERRGRAMGLIELSWAGSALLLLPVLGIVIDQVGWWAATSFLALLALPLSLLIARQARHDDERARPATDQRRPHVNQAVVMSIMALLLMSVSSQFLIVGHGLWLEDTYDFDATQVGIAIVAIGAIEAVGSIASSRFTDMLGKRNSMALGMTLLGAAMAVMAIVVEPRLSTGLFLLITAFLGFEFALVSALPLLVELDPGARAQMLGWALGLSTITRAACSIIGVWLYVNHGFPWLAGLGAAAAAATVGLLFVAVSEPTPTPPPVVVN